jgi:hypothetical protein
MLEFDPEKRLTIEQVRDSAWLNEPVDEAKAMEDVTMYFQVMMKIVEQTDSMVEEETGNFRALSLNEQKMYSLPSRYLLPPRLHGQHYCVPSRLVLLG